MSETTDKISKEKGKFDDTFEVIYATLFFRDDCVELDAPDAAAFAVARTEANPGHA